MVGSVVEQASNGGNKLDSDTNSTPALCCSERMRNADPMEAVKISSLLAFYVGIIQVIYYIHCFLYSYFLSFIWYL